MQHRKELPVPAAAVRADNGRELIRAWATDTDQHISVSTDLWDDPGVWGVVLSDLACNIADSYGNYSESLARMRQGVEAEWQASIDSGGDTPVGAISCVSTPKKSYSSVPGGDAEQHPNELLIPPQIVDLPSSYEILRVWAAEGRQHTTVLNEYRDPAAWGLLLVDIARIAAAAHCDQTHDNEQLVIVRIKDELDAAWGTPSYDLNE
jgi:hypothetical protein